MSKPTIAELHAERDAKLAAEQKAREDRAAAAEKESARSAWLADGGSEEEFEANWPELRQQQRRERVKAAGNQARDKHFAHTRSAF